MRIVLKLEIYCFFFLSYGLLFSMPAEVKTNLQLCGTLYSQMIEEAGQAIPGTPTCLQVNRLDKGHSLDWLVLQQWYQWAGRKAFSSVYDSPTIADSQRCVYVEYRPLALRIQYLEQPGQSDRWQRVIECELAVTVRLADKQLAFSGIKSRHFEDTVAKQDVEAIEDAEIVRGQRPRQGLVARLFQPLVVTAATAAVIYTFYSFRSR